MARIILVHGIDQQQKAADVLESEWLPALAGGMRNAGFREIADRIWRDGQPGKELKARMAFYGHLFRQVDQQGDDPGDFTPEEEAFAERLAEEWLARAAHRASPARAKDKRAAELELAFVRHELGAEEMGAGNIIRKAIRSTARVRWFAPYGMALAERFVKKALAQVTRYLTDSRIREAAQRSVLDLLGPDTQIVIGHSLGSVVAYEAMHKIARALPLFVTMGSPLGLETIVYQRLEHQPPTFPSLVRRWVNVADRTFSITPGKV